MSDRSTQLKCWLVQLGYQDYRLSPASEDASFRSYLRLESGDQSVIVMDAPPDKESCDSFIDVAARLRVANLMAPEVIAQNLDQGFLILSDFGNHSYLSQLDAEVGINLDRLDGSLATRLRTRGARVLATLTGTVGDSGADMAIPLLFSAGATRERLLGSEAACQSAFTSRQGRAKCSWKSRRCWSPLSRFQAWTHSSSGS